MSLAGKQVLLLTSTNLSCNPRCLKEAKLLLSGGAKVTVAAFNLHNWSQEIESKLNEELNAINFYYIESSSKKWVPWLFSSLLEKMARIISPVVPKNIFWAAMAVSKRNWLLLQWVKKQQPEYNLVIAHNPAAFYPAFYLSQKKEIPFALDIEDYHPGEQSDFAATQGVSTVMQMLIPKTSYTSFASPLIRLYSEKLLADKRNSWIVINNMFSKTEFIAPVDDSSENGKVKLVWFSQYISYNRGLEKILPVLDEFSNKLQLTLIGNIRTDFFIAELKERKYINCISSMPQQALNRELSKYDIGLAIEDGATDLNRNICLTNKIWSYFQAGLFIVASDTAAQKIFIQDQSSHGTSTALTKEGLHDTIEIVLQNSAQLKASKSTRFKNAAVYSWENEAATLKKHWEAIMA